MALAPAVSWPWVPAWGSLEPSCQDGKNAQKTGGNGGEMGEMQPKMREGRELTKDQLGAKANRCVDHSTEMCKDPCTGDKSKMCGGFWFVDVFQIRYEILAEN